MTTRRPLLAAAASAAALAVLPAAAPAAEPASSRDRARPVRVDVRIQSFQVQGRKVVAKGVARAGLRYASGRLSQATKPVTFQVRGGGSTCRVLTLKLDTLQLELLGLRVDTSAINLRITGASRGGALGQLFCRLARGIRLNRSALQKEAARSLNKSLKGRSMKTIAFTAHVRPSDQPAPASGPAPKAKAAQAAPAPGSCQVLDLILGPLNLDLLGLRVDLYGGTPTQPVRVLITANPARGVLGQVFCRLASGQAAS